MECIGVERFLRLFRKLIDLREIFFQGLGRNTDCTERLRREILQKYVAYTALALLFFVIAQCSSSAPSHGVNDRCFSVLTRSKTVIHL